LNENFEAPQGDYVYVSGTVIAFFNYNRAVCQTKMKATEELSLASAYPRVIIENRDIALLELKEKPLLHYNAYYAGWDVNTEVNNTPPYLNIHHPSAAVKKYGITNANLSSAKFWNFDANTHWKTTSWNTGSTHEGSSGSPLFRNNLIIGTLSGGGSRCNNSKPDYFTALCQSWETGGIDNSLLKNFLDPGNTKKKQQAGFDPHAENPLVRISNAAYNNGDSLIHTNLGNGFLFGNNDINTIEEFAEEFNLEKTSEILGIYLFIPKMPFGYTSGIEVEIYEGNDAPRNLLKSQSFVPQYLSYNKISQDFQSKNKNTDVVSTESFVAFDNPVAVPKKFFVAYKINSSSNNRFCVYNTQLLPGKPNTAWLKDGQWVKASEYTPLPVTTSLALQPLVRYTNDTSTAEISNKNRKLYYNTATGQLQFTVEPETHGDIFIYSTSGQLIEQIPFSKGEKLIKILPFSRNRSVKIAKIMSKTDVFSEKIIY
jgi:hypothetical protein